MFPRPLGREFRLCGLAALLTFLMATSPAHAVSGNYKADFIEGCSVSMSYSAAARPPNDELFGFARVMFNLFLNENAENLGQIVREAKGKAIPLSKEIRGGTEELVALAYQRTGVAYAKNFKVPSASVSCMPMYEEMVARDQEEAAARKKEQERLAGELQRLETQLANEDSFERVLAAEDLGKLNSTAATPLLLQAAKDQSIDVRRAAYAGLSQLANQDKLGQHADLVWPLFRSAFDSEAGEAALATPRDRHGSETGSAVRKILIYAIAASGENWAVEALSKAYHNVDDPFRSDVVTALTAMKAEASLPVLEEMIINAVVLSTNTGEYSTGEWMNRLGVAEGYADRAEAAVIDILGERRGDHFIQEAKRKGKEQMNSRDSMKPSANQGRDGAAAAENPQSQDEAPPKKKKITINPGKLLKGFGF